VTRQPGPSAPFETVKERKRPVASSSKRQTTMAKLAREQSVREKRVRKQEKRDARKEAAAIKKDEPEVVLESLNAPVPLDEPALP
jgi:hypothetical protein